MKAQYRLEMLLNTHSNRFMAGNNNNTSINMQLRFPNDFSSEAMVEYRTDIRQYSVLNNEMFG